ncbi:MAG TPA: hypothetical protein VFA07_06310 [Chthonomonadaceae bacterium]|nr:hypothetical protein [Chthonomonadaceae bacterium]
MWIQVGRFHFNTDNLTYVQVEMNETGTAPKKVHLHFTNDRDNFALHNADAADFLSCIDTISSGVDKPTCLEHALVAVGR